MSGFSVYSLSPLSLSVRTFSLLGEKGEGVVFSRPLKGPTRGVRSSYEHTRSLLLRKNTSYGAVRWSV